MPLKKLPTLAEAIARAKASAIRLGELDKLSPPRRRKLPNLLKDQARSGG